MSTTLLVTVTGNMTFNRTIFPPHLYVYDDLLIYRKRKLLSVKEITISYNQVSQVILTTGIFFSNFEVITTGDENITVKFANKRAARLAKNIIDKKLYHAHAKHQPTSEQDKSFASMYEKSLLRLKELLSKGKITQKEFNKAKEDLIKRMN